jgi:hypothetical protein
MTKNEKTAGRAMVAARMVVAAAAEFEVPAGGVVGAKSRNIAPVMRAQRAAMFGLIEFAGWTLEDVGKAFRRTPKTVEAAVRKAGRARGSYPDLCAQMNWIANEALRAEGREVLP